MTLNHNLIRIGLSLAIFFLLWLGQTIQVSASYGNDDYVLFSSKNTDNIISYKSLGCADSCWQAELKSKRTRKTKITLQCDGEQLFVGYNSHKPLNLYKKDCHEFECDTLNCKTNTIIAEMNYLLKDSH